MLTQAHIEALTALAGRPLTEDDAGKLDPLVAMRNDTAIAMMLSAGRKKHGPTQIGSGTVMVVFGTRGGAFLDAVEVLGATDRNVYWGFDPVRRGVLDLGIPAGRAQLARLKDEMVEYAADLDKLLMVGVVADPLQVEVVSRTLNEVEGRMAL